MREINGKQQPLMQIRDLKKYFSTSAGVLKAVDGINLDIPRNKIIGLVGESGSGKSTLGKMLIGLHNKTAGVVEWSSTTEKKELMPQQFNHKNFRHYSREIQMIFQDPYSALNPRMQVWQILEEPCLLSANPDYKKLSKKERLRYLQQWLEKVGLNPNSYARYPHEFSGGQRQRIGIARALMVKPRLLICDEPISALDVSVQAQIVNLLKDLQAELDMSILFIAHDLAMVKYLCDEVAVMYLGKIVEQGQSEQIFNSPLHPYTQLLIASNPDANPKVIRKNAQEISGEIPSPINLPEGCHFFSRCVKRLEKCEQQAPSLEYDPKNKARLIACFNY